MANSAQSKRWRLGIEGKLTLILVALSTVPLVLIGGLVIHRQITSLQAEQLRRVKNDVTELKERVALFLSGIEKEARVLANTTEMRKLTDRLQSTDEPTPALVAEVEREFANLLEVSPSLLRVAFFDPQGGEVVAVSSIPTNSPIGRRADGERRLSHYYVYVVGGLVPGELLFSPCEVQLPEAGLAPAIDCILPLFGPKNELLGILVGSINARALFAILDSYNHSPGKILVTNSEGYYLYHSQRNQDWNRLLARREEENLLRDYPGGVGQAVLASASGTFIEDPERILQHTTIFPFGGGKIGTYHLIREIPTRDMFAAVRPIRWVLTAGLLGVGLLSVVCAKWLARRFLAPIRQLIQGTTILRQGQLDYKLEVRTTDELQDLVENFNEMVAHWRQTRLLEARLHQSQKMETVGSLAGQVVHEINNPIAVISAKAHLLLSDHRAEMSEKIASDLGKISDLADRVARVSQGLLSYCRPSNEALRVALDIREPVRRALGAIEALARGRGIQIDHRLPDSLPPVKGNTRELEQVFLHLFANALDAMSQGGCLRVATSADPVRLETGQPALALTVEDTGTGIPPELFGRIFEPFFTSKKTGLGAGLGLAICQGFVRGHGGVIEVQSQVGRGSCFTVKLPLDIPARKERSHG